MRTIPDISFIVAVQDHSPDGIDGVGRTIRLLNAHFTSHEVLVVERGAERYVRLPDDGAVRYHFILGTNPHARWEPFNFGISASARHAVCILDGRTPPNPEALARTFDAVRDGKVDAVFPPGPSASLSGLVARRESLLVAGGFNPNVADPAEAASELEIRMRRLGIAVSGSEPRPAACGPEIDRISQMDGMALMAYVHRGFRLLEFDPERGVELVNNEESFAMRPRARAPRASLAHASIALLLDGDHAETVSCLDTIHRLVAERFEGFEMFLYEQGTYRFRDLRHRPFCTYKHIGPGDPHWLTDAASRSTRSVLLLIDALRAHEPHITAACEGAGHGALGTAWGANEPVALTIERAQARSLSLNEREASTLSAIAAVLARRGTELARAASDASSAIPRAVTSTHSAGRESRAPGAGIPELRSRLARAGRHAIETAIRIKNRPRWYRATKRSTPPHSVVVSITGPDTWYASRCLDSFARSDDPNREIVVVASGCSPLLRLYLTELKRQGHVHEVLFEPSGTARPACIARGFARASSELLFHVANDSTVSGTAFAMSAHRLAADARLGLIGNTTKPQRASPAALSAYRANRGSRTRRRHARWLDRARGIEHLVPAVDDSFFGMRRTHWERLKGAFEDESCPFRATRHLSGAIYELGLDTEYAFLGLLEHERTPFFTARTGHRWSALADPERHLDQLFEIATAASPCSPSEESLLRLLARARRCDDIALVDPAAAAASWLGNELPCVMEDPATSTADRVSFAFVNAPAFSSALYGRLVPGGDLVVAGWEGMPPPGGVLVDTLVWMRRDDRTSRQESRPAGARQTSEAPCSPSRI